MGKKYDFRDWLIYIDPVKKRRPWVTSLTIAGAAALLLSGCAAATMESELLKSAVDDRRVDEDAEVECLTQPVQAELVAALDSTSAEVLEVGRQVETKGDWADFLPPDPDNFVAICVYDIRGMETPFGSDDDYMAFWSGRGDNTGGQSLITIWSEE